MDQDDDLAKLLQASRPPPSMSSSMFGAGDDDENPFSDAISPFGSSSVYQSTSSPFASSPNPELNPYSSSSAYDSPYSSAPAGGPYSATADDNLYGPPLSTPILPTLDEQANPYLDVIDHRQDNGEGPDEGFRGEASSSRRDFGGAGGGAFEVPYDPSPSTSSSLPLVVDLHAAEDAVVSNGGAPITSPSDFEVAPSPVAPKLARQSSIDPLLSLLGESEETKLKTAFKPSSPRSPAKKSTPPKVTPSRLTPSSVSSHTAETSQLTPQPVNPSPLSQEGTPPTPPTTTDDATSSASTEEAPLISSTPPAATSNDSTPSRERGPPTPTPTNIALPPDSSPTPTEIPLPPSRPPSQATSPAPPTDSTASQPESSHPNEPSSSSSFTSNPESTSSQSSLPPSPKNFDNNDRSSSHRQDGGDRVLVSPLETPKSQTPTYARSFSNLSLGGADSSGWPSTDGMTRGGIGGGDGWGGSSSGIGALTDGRGAGSPEVDVLGSGGAWGGPAMSSGMMEAEDDASRNRLTSNESELSDGDEDDEDSRPIRPKTLEPETAAPSSSSANQIFDIHVGDPTKRGIATNAHIVYTVTTRTTSNVFSRSNVSVLRRFSDFLWLYQILQINNPGVVVPPVPEKHPFGAYIFARSDAKNSPARRFAEDFVESRRSALENCLQKIANHPVLQLDPDLRTFLESDTLSMEMKSRKAELAGEQKGYLASLAGTIVGAKFVERDEWFDVKRAALDILESQLKALVKSIELVSKQRIDLATATSDFADTLAALSICDLNQSLSDSLERFADIGRRSRDVHEENAKNDVRTFMSAADEYIRLIASVRLAFASRVKTYLSWQSLESESRRLRTNLERARKSGKMANERLPTELQIVGEAERRAKEAQTEFETVSRLVKNEVARFENERVEDFKAALEAYVEHMIAKQKVLIAAYDDYHSSLLQLVQANQKQIAVIKSAAANANVPQQQQHQTPIPPSSQQQVASAPSSPEQPTFANRVGGADLPPVDNAWA